MRWRGQPLIVLGAVFVGWFGIRATVWQLVPNGWPVEDRSNVAVAIPKRAEPGASPLWPDLARAGVRRGVGEAGSPLSAPMPHNARTALLSWAPTPSIERLIPGPLAPATVAHEAPASSHPSAPGIPAAAAYPVAFQPLGPSRWSSDGWVLLRDDTVTPVLAGLPSYGRSQAGAVLRYRLGTLGGRNPQLHLRVSSALTAPHGEELAAGISARVQPRIPVRVALEARAGELHGDFRIRPAVYAVSEVPLLELPGNTRGEIYFQGGYVGGADATAFADGQVRVQRTLRGVDETGFSAGIGAWGGTQEGASRLDLGPTFTQTFRLGQTRARLSVDYRFRAAGDAEPKSGPALTLSAGF